MATNAPVETKSSIENVLTRLYSEFSRSIVRVKVTASEGVSIGTGFYAKDGVIVAAKETFAGHDPPDHKTQISIEVPHGTSPSINGLDVLPDFDLVQLFVNVSSNVVPLKISVENVSKGESIFMLGVGTSNEVTAITGIVITEQFSKLVVAPVPPNGFSGAPILNSRGEAIAMTVGDEGDLALAVPFATIEEVLERAGLFHR